MKQENKMNKIKKQLSEMLKGKHNGDLFTEVRQRVAAFKYNLEFWGDDKLDFDQDELLDAAYRFLYQSVDIDFILFCAEKEKMDPVQYCKMLIGD